MNKKFVYDPTVPQLLKHSQQWFASIITQPINESSKINPITPQGKSIAEEAAEYIAPSPTLKPHQRIELYNQQYWWRLLSILQDGFPLLVRLFGYYEFNQKLAIPYLQKYPPNCWSLNVLGARLPQWIMEEYHESDQELSFNAALIDWYFNEGFTCIEYPALTTSELPNNDISLLADIKIYLQPYLKLVEMPYHLLNFREQFLKEEPDYWIEHDFPDLAKDKTYFFVLFRNLKNESVWKEIAQEQFRILQIFLDGSTIEKMSEWVEMQTDQFCEEVSIRLAEWFQEWTIRRWLYTPIS